MSDENQIKPIPLFFEHGIHEKTRKLPFLLCFPCSKKIKPQILGILGILITSASEQIPSICEICGSPKNGNKKETDLSDLSDSWRIIFERLIFQINQINPFPLFFFYVKSVEMKIPLVRIKYDRFLSFRL